jgi:5-methylcytosine-specific restriction enzyme A
VAFADSVTFLCFLVNIVDILMVRLRAIPSRIGKVPPRIPIQSKVADGCYKTPQHRKWAIGVKAKANFACEMCGAKDVKLYADHIIELIDGGANYDQCNGQALCARCHGAKTNAARLTRHERV